MDRTFAFTDESGAFGWNFDLPNVSTHFVIASIIVKENDLVSLQEGLDKIRQKYFGNAEMKSKSIGNNSLETRSTYLYDPGNNIGSIATDGIETVYIWSYNGQYPIARIEGLAYAEVKAAIGSSAISTLLNKAVPSTSDISSLRNAVKKKKCHITTYTYKPLVGIETVTLPNGMETTYRYDGFGRLTGVIDHNGSVVSTNSYNYKK